MEYPIMSNGARIGTLKVEKRGLMTCFEAAAADTGELLRLWVYGGGDSGYLGVMQPENGELRLSRRLSRAALSGFPERMEYAGPEGERPAAGEGPEGADIPAGPGPGAGAVHGPAAGQEVRKSALTDPEPGGMGDVLWFSAPDGSLSAFDGRRMLLALPAESVRLPAGAQTLRRFINGREYVVFPR